MKLIRLLNLYKKRGQFLNRPLNDTDSKTSKGNPEEFPLNKQKQQTTIMNCQSFIETSAALMLIFGLMKNNTSAVGSIF